jgi:hypothetical protein
MSYEMERKMDIHILPIDDGIVDVVMVDNPSKADVLAMLLDKHATRVDVIGIVKEGVVRVEIDAEAEIETCRRAVEVQATVFDVNPNVRIK